VIVTNYKCTSSKFSDTYDSFGLGFESIDWLLYSIFTVACFNFLAYKFETSFYCLEKIVCMLFFLFCIHYYQHVVLVKVRPFVDSVVGHICS